MTIINDDYPLLKEEDDFYILDSIVSGGDTKIQLKKRLHILEDIFSVGNLDANCDIVVAGTVIVHGGVSLKGFQVGKTKMLGQVHIDGDFMSKESAILGPTFVHGDIVTYKDFTAVSEFRVDGNMASTGNCTFAQEVFVTGKLYVNGLLTAKDKIFAEDLKINNIKTSKYGRFILDEQYVILYGDGIGVHTKELGWAFFDNIEAAKEILNVEDESIARKDSINRMISVYEMINKMQFTVAAPVHFAEK